MRSRVALVGLFLLFIVLARCANAQPNDRLVASRRHADRWEEAFVSGNGRMGAMLFGSPEKGTLVANHCRLFLPLGSREIVPDLASHLPELRKSILGQGYKAAMEFLLEKAKEKGFPGIIPTDPFHPGAFVHIRQTSRGPAREYLRTENLRTGEIRERWLDSRGTCERRIFVSRAHNAIVMSINGPGSGMLDCELDFASIAPKATGRRDAQGWTANVDKSLIDSHQKVDANWVTYHNIYTRGKGGYDTAVRIVQQGGKAQADRETIKVSSANSVLLLIRIVPWKTPLPEERSEAWAYSSKNPDFLDRLGQYHGPPPLSESSVVPYATTADSDELMPLLKQSIEQLPTDYDELLKSHAPLHRELFDRVTLRLGSSSAESLDVDEALNNASKKRRLEADFAEWMYDAGRYMFISCAGELPPNLQGIWTGTWQPAWSGDFTLDSNLQLAISHAHSANLSELLEGYYRLVESFYPEWRLNAQRTYGCRGFLTNARASNTALLLHWGKWPGVFWTGGCGWLSHFFYEHWQYSGDNQFLKHRAMPLMEEVAAFYADFTEKVAPSTKLQFLPSYSPESGSGVNATMDVMLAKEVLSNLVHATKQLGLEDDRTITWTRILKTLPEYRINDEGLLAEWIDPAFSDRYGHRHLSHLYAFHEAVDDTELQQPHYQRAARRALRRRINAAGELSTHGRMHQGLAAAHLGMGEAAYERLEVMATSEAMFSSLMCAHEPGRRIFNVDGNGAIPEIINRMLIRSKPGELEVLPALPAAWSSGEIRGIRARQQLTVRRLYWDHRQGQIQVELESEIQQTVDLGLPNEDFINSVKLLDHNGKLLHQPGDLTSLKLRLPEDRPVRIQILY